MTFWRRSGRQTAPPPFAPPAPRAAGDGPRVLVVCDAFVLRGGLLRFERFGRALALFGGELAYLPFAPDAAPEWRSAFDALTPEEAASQRWTATMVPGAAFRSSTVRRLGELDGPQFGVRVQHVLNDMSRRASFAKVNRAFAPDLVVFNNRHWSEEAMAAFGAARRAVLEGAVDLRLFRPAPYRAPPRLKPAIRIGALANKNLTPTIEALALLPESATLHAIGEPPRAAREAAARLGDRVVFRGKLGEGDLPAFFAEVDVVAHTETTAGWANVVAEAMASGVPTIATPAGSLSLAEHEVTALVIPAATPEAIAGSVRRLTEEAGLAETLARNALERVGGFGWNDYARALLDLCAATAGAAAASV